MRAPHPSLQRLFGLAAAPAQRGAAWQALDTALARLDAHPAGLSQAQTAQAAVLTRLDGLVQAPVPAAGLVPLLDRLLGRVEGGGGDGRGDGEPGDAAGHRPSLGLAPPGWQGPPSTRRRSGLQPAAGFGGTGGHAPTQIQAGPPTVPGAAAGRPPALPWPTRPTAMPIRATRLAGPDAGAAANPATHPARPAHSVAGGPRVGSDDGTAAATRPLAGAADRHPPMRSQVHPQLRPEQHPLQHPVQHPVQHPLQHPDQRRNAVRTSVAPPPWADAAAARDHWQQRMGNAGLGGAWQATVRAALADDTPGPPAGPGGARSGAGATAPAVSALPVSALADAGHGAAHSFSHRLDAALRPHAATAAGLPGAGHAAAAPPLSAARVGGFKGLAALGLQAVSPHTASTPAAGGLGTPGGPPQAPLYGPGLDSAPLGAPFAANVLAADAPAHGARAANDPLPLIDQIEAALREQVLRNGIALDGLEPA